MKTYLDRFDAGKILADELEKQQDMNADNLMVLALPRGGVPVAYEIAKRFNAPLDVYITRKLGTPGDEELAMGALSMDGAIVLNDNIIQHLQISESMIEQVIESEKKELERRIKAYRGTRPLPVLAHKIIILVDDGIATGATVRAAIQSLKQQQPKKIIVAVPVAAAAACREIAALVDELVCPLQPKDFRGVGASYVDFPQTSDREVNALLNEINR